MLLLYPNRAGNGRKSDYFIYIPLCFYFIGDTGTSYQAGAAFTFHYASTLSKHASDELLDMLNLHSTMLLLYPRQGMWKGTWLRHLHSTMLLLYPYQPHNGICPALLYLHSTMLLLYPRCLWQILRIHWFTFHYASTLSCLQRLPAPPGCSFTFHYASTLSQMGQVREA